MSNFFKKILPYAAGALGGGVANQFSALQPFSAAISAGAGALANKDNRLAGALQGFAGGGAGSALSRGLSGLFGRQGGSAMSNFGSGAWQGLMDYTGSIPGFKGIGTSSPKGVFAKFMSPAATQSPSSAMNAGIQNKGFTNKLYDPMRTKIQGFLGTGVPAQMGATSEAAAPKVATNVVPSGAGFGKGALNMFKDMLPGMGVAMAGSMAFPGPSSSPDYSGIQSALQKQMETNPALLASQAYNAGILNNAGLQDAEATIALQLKDLEDKRTEALRQNDFQFNANLGGNYTGNSDYQRSVLNINNQYDTTRAAMMAQSSANTQRLNIANKQAAAAALQGLGSAQIEFYAGLAGLSVQQLQEQFQLDAGRAQSLADIAKYAGQIMMESQLPQGKAQT